jgi:hypothetical protein
MTHCKKEIGDYMSATEEQQFRVPSLIMNETPISTSDSGPYYVYTPGITLTGLKSMVFFFNTIPANSAFKLTSGDSWSMPNQLPEGAAQKKRDVQNPYTGMVIETHHARTIPAQDTLNTLLSDRSLTSLGLTQLAMFDKINAFEDVFNRLIEPERVDVGLFPESNPQWKKIATELGMLELRGIWLESALEALETGKLLVDIDRVVSNNPYLLDVWKSAIKKTILPSLNAFKTVASVKLSAIEDRIRAGKQLEYDPFSTTLMWLLGRKPERTALSRIHDATNRAQGGITPEQIRALVQETVAATQPVQPAIVEQMQCSNCGEFVNMVAGGPPAACRWCGNRFHEVTNPTTFEPEEDEIVALARKIQGE